MSGSGFDLYVFRSIVDDIDSAQTLTDEEIEHFTMYEWNKLLDLAIDNVMEMLYICRKENPQYFEFKY